MFGLGHGPYGRFGPSGQFIGDSNENQNQKQSVSRTKSELALLLKEAQSATHFADVTKRNEELRNNAVKKVILQLPIITNKNKLKIIGEPHKLNVIQEGILSEIDKTISTRKNSTSQWSELAIACLFATSDREMKSIRTKDEFQELVKKAINADKLYCSSLNSYIKHLRSETNFQKIKEYIDNFVLPSGFRRNEILKVWLVGQNIPNDIEPYEWNIGVQKRDKRSDFYGVTRNPLYEDHISVTMNGEEVYPFGFDIKSSVKDYICNIAAGGYSDPEDAQIWKKIYRDTISSLLSIEGTSTISRDVVNSEFRDKSHPYWDFFEILSNEPSFAQGITRSVLSMNVSYPVFFYDGTKVVDLHKLGLEIDLSKSQIQNNGDRNATSAAAKYFYSLENYNNMGHLISKHDGECRLKNPSVIKSTTNIDAQSMLQGFSVDPRFIENGRQDSSSASGGGGWLNRFNLLPPIGAGSVSSMPSTSRRSSVSLPPVHGKSGGRGGSRKRKTIRRRKTRRRK